MARKTTPARGAKKRADDLFSKIVRSRGACVKCGSTQNLQCAHIESRRFSNTRCDEANALCACAGCHHFWTDHPVDFGMFVVDLIGAPAYAELRHRAQANTKVVWVDVVQRLKLRAKELELV
jgi:hypothetical protein